MKLVACIVFTCAIAHGQQFDAASIRPSPPQNSRRIRVQMDGGPGTTDPARFSCRCSLTMLVMEAYNVKYYQIAGLNSRESDLYDIIAKVPPGTTRERFRLMLQKLLADRFHMALHYDARQMPAYDLVVAKSGPKIKNSQDYAAATGNPHPSPDRSTISLDPEGFPVLPPGTVGVLSIDGKARMQGVGDTMDQVAAKIENQLDLPVVNATSLSGKYDFTLHWAAESPDTTGPSIFSAVESDLGLKLSPRKASVPVIVIDHIDPAAAAN